MTNTIKRAGAKRAALRKLSGGQVPCRGASEVLRVEVTRINYYERNPRRSKNPEYDRIKASILASGMDQPLLITKRPGEEDYIVQAGGNTRLQILKELLAATGEERFLWVNCHFVDWDCESTVLLAHMRENELRGNLTFIDKARAVFEIKSLLAKELGVSDISLRELENILREHGYSVSYVTISQMGYASSVLLPLMPIALGVGLGKLQVQRIRNLERVGRDVWSLRGAGAEAEYDAAFEALCRRHDSMDWQLEPLRQAIENEIAEAAEVNIQVVRMEIDCRLSGQVPDIPDFVLQEPTQNDEFLVSRRDEVAVMSEAERQAEVAINPREIELGSTVEALVGEQIHTQPASGPTQAPMKVSIELPAADVGDALFRRLGTRPTGRVPIDLLRKTAFTLAQRLAERHGLGALIVPLAENGLGFIVRDIPEASVVEQLDDELRAAVSAMWWQLTTFAEMVAAPTILLEQILDESSVLRVAITNGDTDRLSDTVAVVDPARFAQQFWRQLNHEDWCDWLCLAHNYRELHRVAKLLNTALWSSAR